VTPCMRGVAVVLASATAASVLASCGSPRPSSEPSPAVTVPPVAEFAGGVKVDGDAEHAIIASWNNIKQKSRLPDESLHNYEIVVIGRRSEGYGVEFLLKAPPNSPAGTVVMGGDGAARSRAVHSE
jgi:hypothetical protein